MTGRLCAWAATLLLAAPVGARAQIISTILPAQADSAVRSPASTKRAALHFMAGYANWDFNTPASSGGAQTNFNKPAGSEIHTQGGRNGFIAAADIAARVGRAVVSGGAWFNTINSRVSSWAPNEYPEGIVETATLGFSSVYGNVFFSRLGVQAGIVPVRLSVTTLLIDVRRISDDDGGQTDADVFGVARLGNPDQGSHPVSAVVGVGIYRYGARVENWGTRVGPPSPSTVVPSAFANATIGMHGALSLDLSFWYTAADKYDGKSSAGGGNNKQARFAFGLGYRR